MGADCILLIVLGVGRWGDLNGIGLAKRGTSFANGCCWLGGACGDELQRALRWDTP